MMCCGQKRAQLLQTSRDSRTPVPGETSALQHQASGVDPVYFQYVGKTGLTVIGRETHVLYRFDRPGMVVIVDARDKRSLESVPTLRQVKSD